MITYKYAKVVNKVINIPTFNIVVPRGILTGILKSYNSLSKLRQKVNS